jgi:DNA adenine methylase
MEEPEVADLKPPFCRQGNKFPLRNKIIPLFPEHTTYVEPFAGSSAIFFNKPKAEVNVLNDLDKQTIYRYKLLKKAPTDKNLYNDKLNSLEKLKQFYTTHSNKPEDLLLLEKIKACAGFSGLPADEPKKVYKSISPIKIVDLLGEYQSKLRGVKITNQDYAKIIAQYDSPTTLFFLDPPYENTYKNTGYAQTTDFDFERLNEVLKTIKGHFLMTINNSPRIRKLFKGFYQKPVNVPTGWGNQTQSVKGAVRKELFITNYPMGRAPKL